MYRYQTTMKIAVVFNGTFPNGGPMSKRLHLYCKGINELGHSTEIIIPHETVNPRNKDAFTSETSGVYEGVKYRYLSSSRVRSESFFKRKFLDIKGNLKALYYLFNIAKPQIILLVDIRNYLSFLIILVNIFFGFKIVYELNEHPLVFKSKLGFLLDRFLVYPFIHGFIVISTSLETLMSKIAENAKIILLPIIVQDRAINLEGDQGAQLEQPYILHSGGLIDSKDGIIGMLEAFLILARQNIKLNFYLTGSPNESLCRKIAEVFKDDPAVLQRIKFLGYLPEDILKVYQSNSTLFIINKPNTLQNNYCFPTKLGEYLSFSKPIILTGVGEVKNYFRDEFNAYIVETDRPDQIADKVVLIMDSPLKSKQIGIQGNLLISTVFDYRLQTARLAAFFSDFIENKDV